MEEEGEVCEMTFQERKNETQKELEELKEDITTLNQNIAELEEILECVNCEEDVEKYKDFDLEKGLKHIELF